MVRSNTEKKKTHKLNKIDYNMPHVFNGHIFLFEKDNIYALYDPFSLERLYGDTRLKITYNFFKRPHYFKPFFAQYPRDEFLELCQNLIDKHFLVRNDYDREEPFRKTKSLINLTPELKIIYLLVTDECNLDCKYCFFEGNLQRTSKRNFMKIDTALRSINFFINHAIANSCTEKETLRVVFYGGEPLLNWQTMEVALKYIKKMAKKQTIETILITNGTCITQEIAKSLAAYEVGVGVSIDGSKEIHDQMRISKKGLGSYDEAIRGYWILKNAGVNVSVSCTVWSHNVNNLTKVVDWIITKLRPSSITFNFPIGRIDKSIALPSVKLLTKNIIDAFKLLRTYGIYEDKIMRKLIPFVTKTVYLKDCGAIGNQIVITPVGDVGPCHGFIGHKEFFPLNIHDRDLANKLDADILFRDWCKRTPFHMPECYNCPAITICGGGCPYQAHIDHGTIWARDKRRCFFAKHLLEWMIWDLWDKIVEEGAARY